jgi:hypothetical protein
LTLWYRSVDHKLAHPEISCGFAAVRPERDLELTLVNAVAVIADGFGVAGAIGDDEELERLDGHGGRGRGRYYKGKH